MPQPNRPANAAPVPRRTRASASVTDTTRKIVTTVIDSLSMSDPYILAEVSRNLGEPMVGRQISSIPEVELIAGRGW